MIGRIATFFTAILLLAAAALPVQAHGDKPHDESASASVETDPNATANGRKQSDEANGEAPTHPAASETGGADFISLLKGLHPATVHFPIALLVVAALAELWMVWRPSRRLEGFIAICVKIAAIAAIVAAGFGWVHTGVWLGGDSVMQWHRWTGTGIAIFALVLAWLVDRVERRGRGLFRAGLGIAAVAILVQGYWGGEIAHGPGHMFASH